MFSGQKWGIKKARVIEHEHKGRVVNMKLRRLVNSGVERYNTKHKGSG